MNLEKAQTKAKFLNRLVNHPSISYEVREIRTRRTETREDYDVELFVPSYEVVQVVGNVVWKTY